MDNTCLNGSSSFFTGDSILLPTPGQLLASKTLLHPAVVDCRSVCLRIQWTFVATPKKYNKADEELWTSMIREEWFPNIAQRFLILCGLKGSWSINKTSIRPILQLAKCLRQRQSKGLQSLHKFHQFTQTAWTKQRSVNKRRNKQ